MKAVELKETKHLSTSAEINVVEPSKRNNSEKRKIYDIFFSAEEDVLGLPSVDNKASEISREEQRFSNVSTLEWLQTWRSTKIS